MPLLVKCEIAVVQQCWQRNLALSEGAAGLSVVGLDSFA
jgi:hypothetical protein